MDLAKAVDTVNHRLLLEKLYNYGIRGSAHNLLKSYLSNRQQKVKLNKVSSQLETDDINGLLQIIPEDSIVAYPDDTAIVTTAKTWKEVETKMNETLHILSTWLSLNKLSLNTDKTVYIEFCNQVNSTPKNLNINIQGTKIKRVESNKYLVIIFDSNMRWNDHIGYI